MAGTRSTDLAGEFGFPWRITAIHRAQFTFRFANITVLCNGNYSTGLGGGHRANPSVQIGESPVNATSIDFLPSPKVGVRFVRVPMNKRLSRVTVQASGTF